VQHTKRAPKPIAKSVELFQNQNLGSEANEYKYTNF